MVIDKFGRRALFIMISSFITGVVCIITIILVKQDFQTKNWSFLAPMILLGFSYSMFAGTLWASIPFTVKENTIGTAFGFAVSV